MCYTDALCCFFCLFLSSRSSNQPFFLTIHSITLLSLLSVLFLLSALLTSPLYPISSAFSVLLSIPLRSLFSVLCSLSALCSHYPLSLAHLDWVVTPPYLPAPLGALVRLYNGLIPAIDYLYVALHAQHPHLLFEP